jgi:uncharacterized membrane protein (UPF0127 family)
MHLAIAALILAILPQVASAVCVPDKLDIRSDGGAVQFTVEIADDAAERSQGLMHRQSMPRFHGMLFVYEEPQAVAFWMKNTPLPLDMLFFDETGVLRRIHAGAVPFSTDSIPGGDGIQHVLEINGGLAERIGIAPGAQMRHPLVDQAKAAWPCAGAG